MSKNYKVVYYFNDEVTNMSYKNSSNIIMLIFQYYINCIKYIRNK